MGKKRVPELRGIELLLVSSFARKLIGYPEVTLDAGTISLRKSFLAHIRIAINKQTFGQHIKGFRDDAPISHLWAF